MRKNFNKLTAIALSAAMTCASLPVLAQGEIDADTVLEAEQIELMETGTKYGDTPLFYEINEDGTISISDCDTSATGEIIIPSEINGMAVTSIGNGAFGGCKSLTSITIPDSVTNIGDDAFSGCSSLTSITIPDSVTNIGEWAFYNTAYYNNENNWDNEVLYIGNHLIAATTDISGKYDIRENTICIGDDAFSYCEGLTSVTIPDSVTSIGVGAFYECTSLTSINIPDSVTSIGGDVFSRCTGLTSITIPNSVTSIGDYTFSRCTGLTSITIPDSVTSIGVGAFYGCKSLTSITIPDSVTSIGEYAFSECYSLTSVTIPDSVTSIGVGAFEDCTGLANITIPDSITSIGDYAFYDTAYYNDENNWDNGVLYIGNHLIEAQADISGEYDIRENTICIADSAFFYCTGLTSITIPDSVTTIGVDVFSGCESLTNITIPDSVTSIGKWAFHECTGLTSVAIPDSVTSIGYRAFYDCIGLKSVTIGNSVTSIDKYAFDDCTSLTSITIPNSVTSIGWGAFDNCTSLTDVYYSGSSEQWNKINIGNYNEPLTSAAIHFNTIFVPTEVIPAPAITVSAPAVGEDGKSEVEVVVPALEKNYANAVVYAVTDGDIVSQTALVNGGETKLTVPANGTDTVRVFIWNKSMQPITTVYSESIK